MPIDDRQSDSVEGWGRDFFFRRGWRYALSATCFFSVLGVIMAWKGEWDIAVLACILAVVHLTAGIGGRRRQVPPA